MGENKAKDRQELNLLLKFDQKGRWRKRLEKLKTKIPYTLAVSILIQESEMTSRAEIPTSVLLMGKTGLAWSLIGFPLQNYSDSRIGDDKDIQRFQYLKVLSDSKIGDDKKRLNLKNHN